MREANEINLDGNLASTLVSAWKNVAAACEYNPSPCEGESRIVCEREESE